MPVRLRWQGLLAEARWIEHGRKLPSHRRPLSWGARATMRRLCVAMAAFCDPAAPLVRPDMLAWCERLVRECLDVTLTEVAMLAGDDDDRPDAGDKLMAFLVRAGSDGVAMRDLHKLCWAYKRLSTDDRAKLLGRLYEADDITDMATPRGKRIVARQFVVERAVVVTKAAP